jgi:hypothetical protein
MPASPRAKRRKPSLSLRWGAEWYSKNALDGERRYLMCDPDSGLPVVFRTRREARAWIDVEVGYIRVRPDLREEPHGWRLPKAVRVGIRRCGRAQMRMV